VPRIPLINVVKRGSNAIDNSVINASLTQKLCRVMTKNTAR